MKKGKIVGVMSVCAGVLLATLTSVYACHTFHGGGRYFIDPPGIFAEFQLNPNSVHIKAAQDDDSTSFQILAFSTTFHFETQCDDITGLLTVTITGEMESITKLGAGPERQTFAETVPFTVVGKDNRLGAGADFLSLTLVYNASGDQGQHFADLGFGACDAMTCTITFAGPVVDGDLFIHFTGGQ